MLKVIADNKLQEFTEKYQVQVSDTEMFNSFTQSKTYVKQLYFLWFGLSLMAIIVPIILLVFWPGSRKEPYSIIFAISIVVGILSLLGSLIWLGGDNALDYTNKCNLKCASTNEGTSNKPNIDAHIALMFEAKIESMNNNIKALNFLAGKTNSEDGTISDEQIELLKPDVVVLCKLLKITYMEDLFKLMGQVSFTISSNTPKFLKELIFICKKSFQVEKQFNELISKHIQKTAN